MAEYKVESIGATFSDKAAAQLGARFGGQSADGWELHSVFSVQKTGCMGSSKGQTYLAIYRRDGPGGVAQR